MNNKYLYPLFVAVGFMVCSSKQKSQKMVEQVVEPTFTVENTRSQIQDMGEASLMPRKEANDIIRAPVPYMYLVTDKNDTLALVDRDNFTDAYGAEYLEKNRLGTALRMMGSKKKSSPFDMKRRNEILIQFKDNAENHHEYYLFSESRYDFVPDSRFTVRNDVIRYSRELCGPIKKSYAESVAKTNRPQPNIPYLALKSD